jgi:hypothetical protein
MKTKLYIINLLTITAFFLTSFSLNAQCSNFDPTITGNTMICDESDTLTLSTQPYDAYQWYKRDWYWDSSVPNPNSWIAIAGATNQTITVNGTNDLLFEFMVSATLGGCTEDSPIELIDGYGYGLPYLVITFPPDTFEQIDLSEYNVCNGTSVLLENGFSAYGYHTWYNCMPSAIPPIASDSCIIPGQNGLTYAATTNGYYGFYACTSQCPNLCEFLGTFAFVKLNFGDFSFCSLGRNDPQSNQLNINVYPNPTTQFIAIGKISNSVKGDFSIVDMTGKQIKQINNAILDTQIDVSDLAAGTYLLMLKADDKIYRNKFIKK